MLTSLDEGFMLNAELKSGTFSCGFIFSQSFLPPFGLKNTALIKFLISLSWTISRGSGVAISCTELVVFSCGPGCLVVCFILVFFPPLFSLLCDCLPHPDWFKLCLVNLPHSGVFKSVVLSPVLFVSALPRWVFASYYNGSCITCLLSFIKEKSISLCIDFHSTFWVLVFMAM